MEESKSEPNPADVADVAETITSKKSLQETAKEVMAEMNSINFAQVYQGALLDRKKESFELFQNTETQRRNLVESHRAIITDLAFTIDDRLNTIESGMDKIVKFLKDRAQQEEDYVKIMRNGLPKLTTAFKDPIEPGQFMNFARALQECDDFHVRQSTNCEALAKFIRKNIIDGIIKPSEKRFKKQMADLIAPIEDTKKKLIAVAQERNKKIKVYVTAYNEAQRGGKPKQKDLFKNEMENMKLGYEELRLMKAFASQVLVLWNEAAKMLIMRFGDIQKAFTLYFQKHTDVYGNKAANPEVVIKLVEQLNSQEEVQQAFRIKNMMKAPSLEYLRTRTGKTEISFQEVVEILANVPPPPDLTMSPLVVKQWKASRERGFLHSNKTCSVIVTVDDNILVVERAADGELIETDNLLQLINLKIMSGGEKKDPRVVEVMEVIPGFLIDQKKKVVLRFESEDGADEFTHYVNNFKHTRGLEQNK